MGPNGEKTVKNDVSKLMGIRAKVIISEKAESPTERMSNIQLLSEYQRNIPQENIVTRSLVSSEIAENIEHFSKETRKKLHEAGTIEYELALTSMKVQKAKMELELANIEAVMAEKQQDMQQPPPGGPGMGMPDLMQGQGQGEQPAPSPEDQGAQSVFSTQPNQGVVE